MLTDGAAGGNRLDKQTCDSTENDKSSGLCRPLAGFVLIGVFIILERLALYDVVAFLEREWHVFGEQEDSEVRLVYAFNACCYFLPILGGLLADKLGKSKVVFVGLFLYAVGLVVLFVDCPALDEVEPTVSSGDKYCSWKPKSTIAFPLCLIALGAAFVKTNLIVLLLKQGEALAVNHTSENWFIKALVTTETWFALSFMFISVGEALAWLVGSLHNGFSPLVQASMIVFVFILYAVASLKNLFASQNCKDGAVLPRLDTNLPTATEQLVARENERTRRKELLKQLFILLPLYGLLVTFWMAYSQILTFSLIQVTLTKVNTNLNGGNLSSVSGFQGVTSTIVTIALVIIYSCLRAKRAWDNILFKMGLGMVCGCLSLLTLGAVEIYRKSADLQRVELNIVLPQYVLISIAETFVSISGFQFFYTKAPKTLECMSVGMFLSTVGFGIFLGITATTIFEFVLKCSEMSCQNLDWYAYGLAIILLLNFAIFWWYSHRFNNRQAEQQGETPATKTCRYGSMNTTQA